MWRRRSSSLNVRKTRPRASASSRSTSGRADQTRTVRSSEPVAMNWPSGDHATRRTCPSWPLSTSTRRPVATSHSAAPSSRRRRWRWRPDVRQGAAHLYEGAAGVVHDPEDTVVGAERQPAVPWRPDDQQSDGGYGRLLDGAQQPRRLIDVGRVVGDDAEQAGNQHQHDLERELYPMPHDAPAAEPYLPSTECPPLSPVADKPSSNRAKSISMVRGRTSHGGTTARWCAAAAENGRGAVRPAARDRRIGMRMWTRRSKVRRGRTFAGG